MRSLICLLPLGLVTCSLAAENPDGPCGVTIQEVVPADTAPHVPVGTAITWTSNPPSSGPHFGEWAKWGGPYLDPVLPRGHWVHNLEHGGVAILLQCEPPCTDVLQQVQSMVDALPREDACPANVRRRLVVARDPDLPQDVQIAAAAWGYVYTAKCFDGSSLRNFILDNTGNAPEDTCAEGTVP